MAASTALNLSLLSRGIGEVKRNGSEKVDVIFEPQDYFNFAEESGERPFFLPPLQPRYGFTSEPSQTSRCISKDAVHLPKTFTTRKGALLLFSEDMAQKKKKPDLKKHRAIPGFHSEGDATLSTLAEESVTDRNLKTVEDLARSIMAYGNIDSGNMNLKVMTQRKKRQCDFERQIRPGFSAKRYLSTWTKTWDDTTLEKVISKGYLTEKSLFYYNPLLPHLTRRLNDDLSYYPTPYKLMRSMLMSPGSLSGYTFYRVRPESQETDYYLDMDDEDEDDMRTMTRSVKQAGSVKVASVAMDGQLQEAIYGQLDRQSQTEVLTDLLVKGAVHYAMKTQQEYADKFLEDTEGSPDEFKVVPKFDMREAVETMLQDNEQRVPPHILDANLPERDDRSQHSGSFKGSKLGSHRLLPRERGQGDAVPWHDDISSASSAGAPMPLLVGQAPLPPIGQTYTQLTPIGEASREHTQAFSLPVNDEEEDEGWAGRSMVEKNVEHRVQREVVEEKRRADVDKRKARISAHSLDIEGPAVAGSTHHMSSSDSIGPGSTHSSGWLPPVHKQQWKGSQQSLKSHGSRRAYASDDSDAEAPDEWKIHGRKNDSVKKSSKRESPKSRVTEQEILDKLTTHATHIAESILSHSESGQLLEEDIRTVIQEVMKVQKRNSAGPTVADYRDQIKGNLIMALAKATGLQQSDIPQDAEIDPELLEQLASHTLTPDDIEIVRDVETGRSFIRSRNHQISAAMGGVEKGHIYQSANSTVQWLNIPTSSGYTQWSTNDGDSNKGISIPSERKSGEIGELDIVNYQTQGEEKESARESKAGSEVGSKKASSSVKSSVVSQGKSTVKSDTSIQNADKKSVKSAISFKESQGQEELQQALADLDKPGVVAPTEAVSVKSGKSRVSDDKKSRVSEKEKRDEFVVGKPKDKKPTKAPPVGKKKVEKGKKPGKGKAKKKVEHVPEPETVIEAVSPVKELTPEPPKAESPKPETPVSDRSESVKQESDEEEEYIFVREETVTPEPEVEVQEAVLNLTTSAEEEEPDEEQSEADKLRMISNREARAAKRAAAAEKRRLEVDRKRKEREEQIRREKDEHERQEVLRLEQEELRKQKEEERRLKRQREEEENEEQVREELEKVRREKAEVERERRRKEEYSRKLEMMKARQIEDEKRRQEEAERKRLEEEEHHKEEEEKMAKMAEEERMEYERKKKEEEDERLRKEAEDKKRREEEAIRALEEARRLAEEMARKQAELEARLRFNRSLQLEANGLDHTQDITNAFVFSYFELLQWFGLDIAEFELLKLNQY